MKKSLPSREASSKCGSIEAQTAIHYLILGAEEKARPSYWQPIYYLTILQSFWLVCAGPLKYIFAASYDQPWRLSGDLVLNVFGPYILIEFRQVLLHCISPLSFREAFIAQELTDLHQKLT